VDKARQEPFPPEGVNLERPTVARVYDYYLGGTTNWAIDREFGDEVLSEFPVLADIAKANRQFLYRMVRQLMRQGVRQFIDLGAGVPTMDHTHAVAEGFDPGAAKVVYVDHEPVAVAHSQMLLEENGDPKRHVAINGDIRSPERLWEHIRSLNLIDFDQPVAVLMIAVLHVQQQDELGQDMGEALVARYRDLLSPGSYLTISHLTDDGVPPAFVERMAKLKQMYDTTSSPVIWRTRQQIRDLFADFEILDPGLTWTPDWHPEETGSMIKGVNFERSSESAIFAGVGRKP
jgi:hypothetical protein